MQTAKRKTAARDLDKEIGERVHVLMWRQGITLKAMAERLNVDATGLGKKLKGQRGFAVQEIADLAAELRVSVGHLFGEGDAPTEPRTEDYQTVVSPVVDLAARRAMSA